MLTASEDPRTPPAGTLSANGDAMSPLTRKITVEEPTPRSMDATVEVPVIFARTPLQFPSSSSQSMIDSALQAENRRFFFSLERTNALLYWSQMLVQVLLTIRFVLKMLGANPFNIFATLVYGLTQIILLPFQDILPSPSIHPDQAFEFSTLFAIAMYWLIFWAIRRFVAINQSRFKSPEN